MKLRLVLLAGLALTSAAGATGATGRASGALEVNATLITTRTSSAEFCPPGTSANADCFRYVGDGSIRGYAGATGSLTFLTHVTTKPQGERGASSDIWTGTLAVPGLEFDLTPPMISGAVSKTVRAPRRAKRVRVRYSVTAQDAVDGSVPVDCVPRSGSFFWLGRTRVACTATDSSANASGAGFTVTVKRRAGRSS